MVHFAKKKKKIYSPSITFNETRIEPWTITLLFLLKPQSQAWNHIYVLLLHLEEATVRWKFASIRNKSHYRRTDRVSNRLTHREIDRYTFGPFPTRKFPSREAPSISLNIYIETNKSSSMDRYIREKVIQFEIWNCGMKNFVIDVKKIFDIEINNININRINEEKLLNNERNIDFISIPPFYFHVRFISFLLSLFIASINGIRYRLDLNHDVSLKAK